MYVHWIFKAEQKVIDMSKSHVHRQLASYT